MMIERSITGLMLVVALIHLLPIVGVLGGERLSMLYGVAIDDRNLAILMRHRALLFGILGGLFAYAAFVPALQPVAFTAAAVSLAGLFWFAFSAGGYNEAIRKVVIADIVATICLVLAVVLFLLRRPA